MARKFNWKDKRLIGAVALTIILAGVVILFPSAGEGKVFKYTPTVDLPDDYMIFVEKPQSEDDMFFIAALSTLAVREEDYHPLFIIDETDGLDHHQLWAIEHMDNKDVPKLIFTNSAGIVEKIRSQIGDVPEENVFPITPTTLAVFKGFNNYISVGSYEEALWVAPLAKIDNKVIIKGKSTFSSQEQVWEILSTKGVSADYIVIVNPYDFDAATLSQNVEGYNNYDTKYHVNALSVLAAELAAFHEAYVITDTPLSTEQIGIMDYELNARAIGQYLTIRNVSAMYGPAEYICIVGSAAAVPQFQMPGNGDGDVLVNSDSMYGFLDDDQYTMDAAVGRIINLNLQGASNQLAKTLAYEHIVNTVTVEYSDPAGGTQEVDWQNHGASFSGYQITYQRMQATPARWICEDYEDEGMEYEYMGPSGSGELIGDGVKNSDEMDIGTICEASGFVAYRGHGSDYGSLYSLRVYTDRDSGMLSSDEAAQLDLPPQVAFFVACMNAKIHGTGYGEDAEDVEFGKLFGVNYLYGGALAVGGATEVSYSNVGQDIDALWARYGMGIFHDENYNWDLNDAWFAFFWDGLINHEEEYGTVGKALQWAENRYMKYHDNQVSPFEWTDDDNMGGHWKEVTMFVVYGDPAFKPGLTTPGANQFDPWHNGNDDY
ncbi:C25 family cysteine peptidase [[Eubacterium] cellulosolvens]